MTTNDDVPDRFRVDFTGVTLNDVYLVGEKLADGGMGSIYLAEDTNLGRPVVVKVPHPRFLGEPGFRSRFSREVEELIRLEHPHVARILARGEHEEVPYFVLQYLGGGSLEERLAAAEGRPTPPDEVLEWLADVASTLDFVHAQGLVHRDVKPANILFDEAGHVFLSDFGVAKVVDSDAELTGIGVGIGSPKYMAPEQGTGSGVGPAADQYALAAVVYEALAGGAPYDGATPIEILVKKGREDPTQLIDRVPDLPVGAASAVMRAISTDAGARFESCAAFVRAFTEGLSPEPTPAPEALAPEAPAPRRRHPIWPYFLSGGVVLLGLLLPFFGGGGDGEEAEIRLRFEGAKPRMLLRIAPPADLVQRVRTHHSFSVELTMEGEKPVEFGPIRGTADSELRVESGGPPIPFTWRITSAATPGLQGAGGRGRITDRGRMEDFTIDGEVTNQKILSQLSSTVRQLPVPLPREEVGVGARWEQTETVQFLGMRVVQTSTYEIVGIEGRKVTVRVAAAQTAVPGEILDLGMGPKLRVSSLVASGTGEVELDLDRLVPVRSGMTVKMDIAAQVEGSEDRQERKIHFEVSSSSEPIEEEE